MEVGISLCGCVSVNAYMCVMVERETACCSAAVDILVSFSQELEEYCNFNNRYSLQYL